MSSYYNEVIFPDCKKGIPEFNHELIYNQRKEVMDQAPQYMDAVFREAINMIGHGVEYAGYRVLKPRERVKLMREKHRPIDINPSTTSAIQYMVRFEGQLYPINIPMPYLNRYFCVCSGVKYFPIFSIMERGLHRNRNRITIKVMRAPLMFWRANPIEFRTLSGKFYRETIVTVRIHQGERNARRQEYTPLLVYHLAAYGLTETLRRYAFADREIDFVNEVDNEPGYEYILVETTSSPIYIKFKQEVLEDMFKRRTIAALIAIFKFHRRFNIDVLFNPSATYYKVVLGKFTVSSRHNEAEYADKATRHMDMNKTLIDNVVTTELQSIGIYASTIEDLLFEVFYNIDVWIIDYNPTDLFMKKISGLDPIMIGLVRNIFRKVYDIINNQRVAITPKTISSFVAKVSKYKGWLSQVTMFRPDPDIYGDCSLFTIMKRFRTLEGPESRSANGKGNIPVSELLFHVSQLACEAILTIPASSPVISGDMNPYAQYQKGTGALLPPPNFEQLLNYKPEN